MPGAKFGVCIAWPEKALSMPVVTEKNAADLNFTIGENCHPPAMVRNEPFANFGVSTTADRLNTCLTSEVAQLLRNFFLSPGIFTAFAIPSCGSNTSLMQ